MNFTGAVFQAALALTLLGGGAQSPVPDLSGEWELDTTKSDDAESAVLEAAGKDSTRGIAHLERQRQLDRLVTLARALDTIEIEQTDEDFQIVDQEGNVRIYYLDGRKHRRQTPWGSALDTVAEWQEGRLVVQSRGDEVGEIDEFYGLEGRQLVFIVRIRNPRFENEIRVRHYYHRAGD